MAHTSEIDNVPAAQVAQVTQDFMDAGATKVVPTPQADGTVNLVATFPDPGDSTPNAAAAAVAPVATQPAPAPAPAPASVAAIPPPSTGAPFLDVLINHEFDTDVDGAPNAYGPPGVGTTLDFELNAHVGAKSSGAIVGYITNSDGSKSTQVKGDPCPGYYISTTGYQDIKNPNRLDPRKYVDASKINYVVRGVVAEQHGVHLGDFVAVHSISNNRSVFGIVGDSGNSSGAEGSLALLQALGYPIKSGKSGSVDKGDIIVRYFPNSNPGQTFFTAQSQIDAKALSLGLSKDFSDHVS